jgi:hypothetical protein
MSGGDQQAEDQCGHGRDQPHHQLDDVFGVRVQMVDRQSGVQEESCQRPKKRASEYEHGDHCGTHTKHPRKKIEYS